jgi:hypothetical protein
LIEKRIHVFKGGQYFDKYGRSETMVSKKNKKTIDHGWIEVKGARTLIYKILT